MKKKIYKKFYVPHIIIKNNNKIAKGHICLEERDGPKEQKAPSCVLN